MAAINDTDMFLLIMGGLLILGGIALMIYGHD